MSNDRMRDWIFENWMYAGLVAGVFLLALVPILAAVVSAPFLLAYLLLPIYMIHQVEEHADDRFRLFFNRLIGGGREVLTHLAVVVINIGGVWLVFLLALYAAWFDGIGFGLIAAYTVLVNAVLHIGPAVKLRAYNPGLYTAVLLFVPLGLAAVIAISKTPGVAIGDHVLGLSAAIVLHGAIMAYAKHRASRLDAA